MLPDHPISPGGLGFARDFARPLLDPERAAPADLAGPHGKALGRRYDVYRNNVTLSLVEALVAIYPAVRRIVGEDFFRAMARLHVRASPPSSRLLFEYGRHFPAFIESFAHTQDMPWLADVARLERAWLDAYHASDAAALPMEALAAVPPDALGGLRFRPHPAARVLHSPYPAVTIFAANRRPGPFSPIHSSAAEDALVSRPDMEVAVRLLPRGGAAFLQGLIDGATLAEAATAAMTQAPDFDLGAAIVAMIEAGALTTIEAGDGP